MITSNFKQIHIGNLIRLRMEELGIKNERAEAFLKVGNEELEKMYDQASIDSEYLLAWSKLLEYDFFRIYSQYLILYAPQDPNKMKRATPKESSQLPVFKKNIYTPEVINYLMELVNSGEKTTRQIQQEYNIPATTVSRWNDKYGTLINKHNENKKE